MTVQKECLQVEVVRETQVGCDPSERHWNRKWIDETTKLFFTRGIEIKRNAKDSRKVSQNKTVVECALQHAEQNKTNKIHSKID